MRCRVIESSQSSGQEWKDEGWASEEKKGEGGCGGGWGGADCADIWCLANKLGGRAKR